MDTTCIRRLIQDYVFGDKVTPEVPRSERLILACLGLASGLLLTIL